MRRKNTLFWPSDVFFQSSSKPCIFNVITGRPMNNFCRPVIEILCYWATVFVNETVEITRIHTTLEILLLLQTKVTKHCYDQMRFLGSNATEMCWRPGTPLGELTALPQTRS